MNVDMGSLYGPVRLLEVFLEIRNERDRQERRHGPRTMANPRMDPFEALAILAEEFGELAKEVVDLKNGAGLLLEAERRLRSELVQVAACAVAWLEGLEDRGK